MNTFTKPCPVCGAMGPEKVLGVLPVTQGSQFSRDTFELGQCLRCDLIYLVPTPTTDDFRLMYEDAEQFACASYRDLDKIRSALGYYGCCYRTMLGLMRRSSEEIRLLEIGAGLAWLCRVAKENNSGAFTVAQDVSAECQEECPWADHYVVADVTDARVSELGPYHIISMTHVLDRLPDPVAYLKYLSSLITPDGCVFITAPHRPQGWTSTATIPQWRAWTYNHVPGDLQYFSERALDRAANAVGLRLSSWTLLEDGQAFEAVLRPAAAA